MAHSWLNGNHITLLETGGAFFPALLDALEGAEQEIFLETFIFADDETGRVVAAALRRAALRGVTVRVLVDGFGSRRFVDSLMQELIADGVHVLIYRRELGALRLRRHRLRRLHRKQVVIDGRIAFVGGINIVSDTQPPAFTEPRFDFAVRVEGPLLDQVHASVKHVWEIVAWASFQRRLRLPTSPQIDGQPCGAIQAAYLQRDNLHHRRDIEDAYLEAITLAKREIILANAYFLPGRRFRHAMLEAAERGVTVIVLLQGRVEYLLQHLATQALYGQLLARGVRVFEYHRSLLHAKVAVVDGLWATVGSSNIDPFSLLVAREANVAVRDASFAGQLRTSLMNAIATSALELNADDWARKPRWRRLLHWMAYSVVRLMIGIAGYSGRH